MQTQEWLTDPDLWRRMMSQRQTKTLPPQTSSTQDMTGPKAEVVEVPIEEVEDLSEATAGVTITLTTTTITTTMIDMETTEDHARRLYLYRSSRHPINLLQAPKGIVYILP